MLDLNNKVGLITVNHFANIKFTNHGKSPLRHSRYPYYWMAAWVIRFSRGWANTYLTGRCNYLHISESYPRPQRDIDIWLNCHVLRS